MRTYWRHYYCPSVLSIDYNKTIIKQTRHLFKRSTKLCLLNMAGDHKIIDHNPDTLGSKQETIKVIVMW